MGDYSFGHRVKPGQRLVITAEAVTNVAGQLLLVAGDQPNRISIAFQNKSVNIIYIGVDNTVVANTGRGLAAASGPNLGDGGVWCIDVGPGQVFWAIGSAAGPSNLCVAELVGV